MFRPAPPLPPSLTLLFITLLILALSPGAATSAHAAPAYDVDTVDGRRVESLTMRHPSSSNVIVLEGGSRSTIDKWGVVPGQLAHDATVFAYHRPGYGNSEATKSPRDGLTIVDDLRRLLRHKGLPPPYVLVGHSLGGLYMQLFARRYPQEVAALVLIDALYPGVIKDTADFPFMTRLAGRLAFSRTVWREIEQIDRTGQIISALPGIDDKPIVRLVNQPTSSTAVAVDFGAFRMDDATRDAVRALYPKARRITVDSSHQVALTSPDAVVSAVRAVLP